MSIFNTPFNQFKKWFSKAQAAHPDITGVLASTGSGDLIAPNGSTIPLDISAVWSDYRCMLPLSGSMRDVSGKGNDGYQRPAFLDAAAWANAGYLTTSSSSAEQYSMLGNAVSTVDLTKNHLIFSICINMATPGATVFSVLSQGNGAAQKGIQVNVFNTGKLQLILAFDDATSATIATNGVFADSTDHYLTIVIDRATGHVYVFRDAQPDAFGYGAVKGKTMTVAAGYRMGIGGSVSNADTGFTGKDCKFKGLHIVAPTKLPLNIGALVRAIVASPSAAILQSQVIPREENKKLLVVPFGQSMFAGSGESVGAFSRSYGSPQYDGMTGGVAPNGTTNKRSFWPDLIEYAGQRGWFMHVYNMAQGGTSICDTWVGRIRTWASGQGAVRGSYFKSSDGGLWRADIASGSPAVTSTTEPSGTSNVTINGIPWVYLRPFTAADVEGVVSISSALFDPYGLCARLLVPLAWGFDRVIVPIEFGQTDSGSTLNVTQAHYKDAHKAVAQYALNQGVYKVLIGLSSYIAAGATKYQDVFIPAINAAVSEMADSRVVLGANLYTSLGVLATTPPLGVLGLQSDATHLNSAAYKAGSDVHYRAMDSAGVFN